MESNGAAEFIEWPADAGPTSCALTVLTCVRIVDLAVVVGVALVAMLEGASPCIFVAESNAIF